MDRNNKDLEEFRKQWKSELSRDDGKSSQQNLKQSASIVDCDKNETTSNVQHSLFSVEESKTRPNTYQSFLLAEDLLKQNNSQIHETFSSNVLRRKRSSCDLKDLNNSSLSEQGSSPSSKVPKCDDEENKENQTKERFLDIFLADLVSGHALMVISNNVSWSTCTQPTACDNLDFNTRKVKSYCF